MSRSLEGNYLRQTLCKQKMPSVSPQVKCSPPERLQFLLCIVLRGRISLWNFFSGEFEAFVY